MGRRKKSNQRQSESKIKPLEAKTQNQKDYIRSIIENHVVLCSGPSGSGKSYCAAGIAAEHLHKGIIDKIVVTRPLISAGKEIGSLPGEIMEKIAPYLTPVMENLKHFLGNYYYKDYYEGEQIQYKALELMRGSTFDYTYVLLDEAQNCTSDQLKMILTRIGKGSKVLINGDADQNDLRGASGLGYVMDKLENVEGVGVCELTCEDIQRHGIIADILRALEN
jgi:phosphate starvation-inducible PhoH-like protein